MALTYLVAFVSTLVMSFALTWVVRQLALSRGWAVGPRSPRDLHSIPVPRLGGVAIFVSVLTTVAAMALAQRLIPVARQFDIHLLVFVGGPAALVLLLGLIDDFRGVTPYTKIAVQIIAGLILYAGGYRVSALSLFHGGGSLHGLISITVTVVWVLWITNAFNLLDGLDGLAAGSALFSALVVFVVALLNHNHPLGVLSLILSAAILGFLRFNFNPASIFLGDCGSLVIGFLLSAFSIAGASKSPTLVALAIPVVAAGLPILDTSLAIMRRFLSGQPLFRADREHIHHKLLGLGLSQRQVAVLLYGVSALFALISLFLLFPASGAVALVLVIFGIIIVLGVQQLGYHELSELQRTARRTFDAKRVIVNNVAIRKATAALLDARDFPSICNILETAFANNEFDSFSLQFTPTSGTALSHTWQAREVPQWNNWAISLQLATPDGSTGSLVLRREYRDRYLLFDINTFFGGFNSALADALYRANQQATHSVAADVDAAPARTRIASTGNI